ncbi:aliphatic sulfonate ABC transporter ATP-binding protein [Devosia sp. Root413D1]|uniref:ABC transporter ATP-binding protein n=1 Tax=Devosia sp. Root413D1 TaxID=1736531 RepID=UPI0006F49C0D|nr:ABC transporter ATP-binding protein [Devosia sp. Root413D1]KQW77321.1 aliphatic sulfonate ABC transporter ATP-binding protein [Devosia sp. Root413D1]
MSQIQQARKFNAWGKGIEPEYGPQAPAPTAERGSAVGIRIEGLDKSFGSVPVLRQLDLEVPAGQFLAIVGKSGCGKSTLLRLLTGLDEPTGGRITFTGPGGEAVTPNARIVFQEPRLLPWERVAGNVAVGLGPGQGGRPAKEKSLAALREVQLDEKAGDWPAQLSGGQRQRVALARALVSRPDFLALDEPLGALDALTRITMQGLVERVWREQGFTALFVTHDVGEAVALADRVIVLDEGHIVLDILVEHERPRLRGAEDLARIERQLLDAIFRR